MKSKGLRLESAYLYGDMTVPLVYFVCIAFILIMAMFFVGGAIESSRHG